MSLIVISIFSLLFVFIIWRLLWKFTVEKIRTTRKKLFQSELDILESQKQQILFETDKKNKQLIEETERKSNEIMQRAEKDIDIKQKKIDQYEQRLTQKEQKVDEKYEQLDKKKEELHIRMQELDKIYEEQKSILEKTAWLSTQEAKDQLFKKIEIENKSEIERFINKMKLIKEEESKEEAAKIIAKVLPRVVQDWLSEHLITLVDLPTEDMKGKIIGREWRNIALFERVTWVEVTIDDTPLTIKLSSYDVEKRFLAAETMRRLVRDAKINPVSIEKYYEETCQKVDEAFIKKWRETLALLNIPMLKPEIVEYIGKFHLRYSYWQNLLLHSIEVARLSEMMANELWLNADLAKKAWLLHDIWKIDAGNGEWHARVWAEILRKYGMHDIIINTAEAHHFDVPLLYPETRIATAADMISASRPWARVDSKEKFVERMSNLETLVSSIPWVSKAYIMQAWREIMAFFNPINVKDEDIESLVQTIALKIEEQLDYPWSIRIIWIREQKITHYLR